jgi:hypothetical protein
MVPSHEAEVSIANPRPRLPSDRVSQGLAQLNEHFVRCPPNAEWRPLSSTPTTRAQNWSATRARCEESARA